MRYSCHCAGGQQVEMLEDHADAFALAAKFRLGELHHVFAIDQDFACGRWFKHIDAADQGRFPCTGLPDDTVDLTISDGDADVVQCFEIAIYFRYMFEFNHWSLLIKTKNFHRKMKACSRIIFREYTRWNWHRFIKMVAVASKGQSLRHS